jgi:hypothetical protein
MLRRIVKSDIVIAIKGASPRLGLVLVPDLFGDRLMKLIHPKFAATACLFALLAAPVIVFADGGDGNDWGDGEHHKKHYAVPEPSTLIMTLAGMGLGIGLVIAGVRRNRRRVIAA